MIPSRIFKNLGFTLIEILVVISIIALLASIVLVSLQSSRERAVDVVGVAQERQIRSALELYYADNGYYPAEENWDTKLAPYINIQRMTERGFVYDYEGKFCDGDRCGEYTLAFVGAESPTIPVAPDPGNGNGNGNGDPDPTDPDPADPDPVLVTLLASNSQIIEGQTVTLSWEVSGADYCTASSDWSGDKDKDGGSDAIILSTAGSYVFTLTCDADGIDSSSDSVTVVVNQDDSDETWRAVIEVNESPSYKKYLEDGRYGNISLTDYYAPLPVFFEGWKSEVPDIKDAIFEWDFGDNLPNGASIVRSGFNAAHVYEKIGNHTATLTIIERSTGIQMDSASVNIRVRDRVAEEFGDIYYVDSVLGDDSNSGTSTAHAWRTADRAFSRLVMNLWCDPDLNQCPVGFQPNDRRNPFGPGDQILFKRGQEFEVTESLGLRRDVDTSEHSYKHGIIIGSYGHPTNSLPVIKYTANSGSLFAAPGGASTGIAHLTIRDISFRNPAMNRGFWSSTGEGRQPGPGEPGYNPSTYDPESGGKWGINHVLFYNLDLKDWGGGMSISHSWSGGDGGSRVSGFFLFKNKIEGTHAPGGGSVQFYFHANRLALIDNYFDYSANHIVYGSWINTAVVYKNTFERPAGGRNALRISAASDNFNAPAGNVYLKDNIFRGWIDPRTIPTSNGGNRYNWQLVLVGSQSNQDQSILNVVLEDNQFWDAETLLSVAVSSDVHVFNNFFSTRNHWGNYAGEMISIGGKLGHNFDRRPVSNINFHNNTIISRPPEGITQAPNIFYVAKCGPNHHPSCPSPSWGSSQHENIRFSDNKICWITREPSLLRFGSDVPSSVVSLNVNNPIISGLSTCQ